MKLTLLTARDLLAPRPHVPTETIRAFLANSLSDTVRQTRFGRSDSTSAYVVDGQHFVGRQHLPMIRWLLCGSEGLGPL